jgi:membrane fusion protein (multidrug efflux system)
MVINKTNRIVMLRKHRFFRVPVMVAICMAAMVSGCGGNNGNEKAGGAQPLPAMKLAYVSAKVYSEYPAMIEGRVNVEIRPQVDGTLEKILVNEGAFVNAGQPLFQIKGGVYREQYNQAIANQHAAEAALVNARLDVDKITPLVQNKVVSDVQLKAAKASYQAAKANVEQAKAAAQSAGISLGYTTLRAPVSGYIGKIPYRLGSLVTKNQNESLTVLSDVQEVNAYFSMSETDFIRFRGQYAGATIEEKIRNVPPVTLILADASEHSEKGVLQMAGGQFDNATGAISMKAVFANPQGLLRTGSTGKVRIEVLYNNVLLVPQAATTELQDKVFVFRLAEGNKAVKIPITVSGKSGNSYIVTTGLKPGDVIVTAGLLKLKEGAVVKPQFDAPQI